MKSAPLRSIGLFSGLSLALLLTPGRGGAAELPCADAPGSAAVQEQLLVSEDIQRQLRESPDTIYPDVQAAIDAKLAVAKPLKYVETGDSKVPHFPSYSACPRSFFRVATSSKEVDQTISKDGWKSGWVRRSEELASQGKSSDLSLYDALPPNAPFEDRIIQYVRVKRVPSEFPKHSTVVGVLENPIRTFSVGYHTGFNNGVAGSHMRMDEIELGPCARAPECRDIAPLDSTAVFKKRSLTPRYSTEGEWAVDRFIPPACTVAVYRIKFGKVDDKCYSDVNKNCGFKK